MPSDCDDSVADLEIYGLSVKTIELLDRKGCIYVADLVQLTESEFLSWKGTGLMILAEIVAALQNYHADRKVKTILECIEIQPRVKTNPQKKEYPRKPRKKSP